MLGIQLAALALATVFVAAGCGSSSKSSSTQTPATTASAPATTAANTQPVTTATKPTKPLTRTELITQADAICKAFEDEYHAHGAKTNQQIEQNIATVASLRQAMTTALGQLTPPSSMASDWKQIVNGNQELTSNTLTLSKVKGNAFREDQPLITESEKVLLRTLAIAHRNGFRACARTS